MRKKYPWRRGDDERNVDEDVVTVGRARTIINGTMHSGKSARDEITCCDEGEEISSARITFDYLQEEKRKKKRRKDELLQLYNVNCSRRSRYEEKFRIVFSSVGTEAAGDS